MRQIPDGHLSLATLISLGNSSGSGFLYRTDESVFLVTAKHVLFNEEGKLRSQEIEVVAQSSKIDDDSAIRFHFDLKKLNPTFHKRRDVAIIKYGEVAGFSGKTVRFKFVQGAEVVEKSNNNPVQASIADVGLLDEVLISNDIFISGYPTSLGIQTNIQFDYNKPLLRKGIVANVYKETQTIVLDCPVYGGNSGGPVIQVVKNGGITKYQLVGVVSQYVPYVQRWLSQRDKLVHEEYLNSGYSVATSFDPVIELINEVQYPSRK